MNNALSSITRKVFTLTIVAALTSIKRAFVYIAFLSWPGTYRVRVRYHSFSFPRVENLENSGRKLRNAGKME